HRAPVAEPLGGGSGQLGARRAVVTAGGDPGRAPQALPRQRRERLPDGVGNLRRELVAHRAPDVVLSEDRGGELHRGPARRQLPASLGAVGRAPDVAAGAGRTAAPLVRARSSSRFGRTPKKSKPATDTAT